MTADVLDPTVVVPIYETDLPFFEEALRSVDVTSGFVIDQMKKEEAERADILHTRISQVLHPFTEATDLDMKEFEEEYPTLAGVSTFRNGTLYVDDFSRVQELVVDEILGDIKPSIWRRMWNRIRGRHFDD